MLNFIHHVPFPRVTHTLVMKLSPFSVSGEGLSRLKPFSKSHTLGYVIGFGNDPLLTKICALVRIEMALTTGLLGKKFSYSSESHAMRKLLAGCQGNHKHAYSRKDQTLHC